MGGSGSGRWGGRRRCEDCPSIDVRAWHRDKALGQSEGLILLAWSRDGRSLCSIRAWANADRVVIDYTPRPGEHRVEHVRLTRTPCHYGGTRPWFECSGCHERAAKLFLYRERFRCLRCHGLGYRSQLTARLERPRLIAQRIRRRLGVDPDLTVPFLPSRPKGMPWRTYERLRAKALRYEMRAWANLAAWVERSRARG